MNAYDLPAWEDGDEVRYEEHRARWLALDDEVLRKDEETDNRKEGSDEEAAIPPR